MTLLDRTGRPIVAVPQPEPAKAATGFGVTALTYSAPLWSLQNTPQRKAWGAAAVYATHDGIRKAESSVSEKGGSVGWHLETEDEKTVDDTSDPKLVAIKALLERPQALIDIDNRQAGLNSFRALLTTTLRHMGLCGTTFWYLDQTDALAGVPLGILYLAPWRMFDNRDVRTKRFLGWTLDGFIEDGGTPLESKNILTFYLQPPDQGLFAAGLVEAASTKIPISPIIDRHIAKVIANGGRLAGLLSPKVGSTVTEDNWASFVRDYRNIAASDDAALKLQIVQGPVDFTKTAADMNELAIEAIDERTDNAIRELWHLPGSQTGKSTPGGLNSGATKGFDEAVLWQNAIHPRLVTVYETIQYDLLDRFKALGAKVELVFEEPEFDDDAPMFEIANKAQVIPMTGEERRALVGLDPLDDPQMDKAIFLPSLLVQVAGPGFAEKQAADQAAQQAMNDAKVAALQQPQMPPAAPPKEAPPPPAKAVLTRFTKLRRQVDSTAVRAVQSAVQGLLDEQKASIVRHLKTVGLDHLRAKPKDHGWNKRSDDKLTNALKPTLRTIVEKVATRTRTSLATKAAVTDGFTERVLERVLTRGAGRVVGINRTTRDAVQQAIADALDDATTINDVIAAVEALDIFGELRAETIARTESMFAYNDAALGSYSEMGITEVQAIDGDGDEECAARDGQTYSIDEASDITDHPNGTLDWAPVVPDEEPPQKATRTQIEYDALGRVVSVVESTEPVQVVEPAKASPVILFDRDDAGRISALRMGA